MKKKISIFKRPIIGTILIGLIGAFLWDFIFSPIFNWLMNKIFIMENALSDMFYKGIAQGTHENTSSILFSLIFFSIVSFVIIKAIDLKFEEYNLIQEMYEYLPEENPERKNIKFKIFSKGIVLMLCGLILLSGIYYYEMLATSTTKKILNNIEIVSAYIPHKSYTMLKSKFYTIQSKKDYDLLVEDMEFIAENNNVELQ